MLGLPGPRSRSHYTARSQVVYNTSEPTFEHSTHSQSPNPLFCRRVVRPSSIRVTRFPPEYIWNPPPVPPASNQIFSQPTKTYKLASRESAKRVFGSVLSSLGFGGSAPAPAAEPVPEPSRDTARRASSLASPLAPTPSNQDDRPAQEQRRGSVPASRPPLSISSSRTSRPRPLSWAFPADATVPGLAQTNTMSAGSAIRGAAVPGGRGSISLASTDHRSSVSSAAPRPAPLANVHTHEPEKPLASASGISMAIQLAEPHVYLTGFDHDGRASQTQNSTAMIRGKLSLNVTKSIKIKAVTLTFCGKARTEWPEGWPSYQYARMEN